MAFKTCMTTDRTPPYPGLLFRFARQMPETTDRTFISPYFPGYPVFPDMPYHILSIFRRVINRLFAQRLDRNCLFFWCLVIHHQTDKNMVLQVKQCFALLQVLRFCRSAALKAWLQDCSNAPDDAVRILSYYEILTLTIRQMYLYYPIGYP